MFKKSNIRNQKGAVTIEATISLTTFLFFFIMIYSIITICRAQAHIQIAINNTAKEISQYSYIYGMTGLDSTMSEFYSKAGEDQSKANGFIGNVSDTFNAIQSGLGDAHDAVAAGDVESALQQLQNAADGAKDSSEDAAKALEDAAKNPQQLLFGMARIIGSNSLDLAKSRLIAAPIARGLVKKHLKRSESDTAEAFCKSVGIMPKESASPDEKYFKGLDFTRSTLFPYGSDEITIAVTYKIRLVQLLPVDIPFTITQTAVTKGWLHGDKSVSNKSNEEKIKSVEKDGNSIWNNSTGSERNSMIRSDQLDKLLKGSGNFKKVSSETTVQAYGDDNTFVMISSFNPLADGTTVDKVDKEAIKERLSKYAVSMKASTDNQHTIKLKSKDGKGNTTTSEVNCDGTKKLKVIVVVPEDEGLQQIVKEQAEALKSSGVEFDIIAGYGSSYKQEKTTTEGAS